MFTMLKENILVEVVIEILVTFHLKCNKLSEELSSFTSK